MQTREKFLSDHLDELDRQIWLGEIDVAIIGGMIANLNNKKDIADATDLQNKTMNQLQGVRNRKAFIIKVLNGTTPMVDAEKKS